MVPGVKNFLFLFHLELLSSISQPPGFKFTLSLSLLLTYLLYLVNPLFYPKQPQEALPMVIHSPL